MSELIVQFPPKLIVTSALQAGGAVDSYSVEAQGYGSISGITYTIPAHTNGNIKAKLQTLSLTSNDVANLNELIKGMLSASQYEKVRNYESTHASANISYWSFWSGGGSASYEKTHEDLRGFGLSEENIRTIVNAMAEDAKQMSSVEIDFNVLNADNDYAVSGNLMIYTISGVIATKNGQYQYRFLADKGYYGTGDRVAPATGKIIPIP
jgi:hypothetical protein